LLTAGELARQVLRAMRHADALECIRNALLSLARAHAAIRQRQFNVLVDREVADQVEALEDETNFAVSDPGALRKRKVLYRMTVEDVLTVARCIQQAQNREQSGFAAARRSGDGNVFTLFDIEMNTGECVCLNLVCVEDLLHISKVDQGLGRTHHSLLNEFMYTIFLTEHRRPGLYGNSPNFVPFVGYRTRIRL